MAFARPLCLRFEALQKSFAVSSYCRRPGALSSIIRRTFTTKSVPKINTKYSPHWQLCAAVCLTRLPLVSPHPSEIEQKYLKLLRQQEYERSVLSEWEMEKNRQMEIMHAVEMGEKDPRDIDFSTTNQDIEDENEAKLNDFLEMQNEDIADDSDMKNINRKLREPLVLIIKKRLGNDEVWTLPGLPINENETMRQCAERSLIDLQSNDYEAKIFSNAPSAYYKYKYPKEVRLKSSESYDGAKLFIYSAIAKSLKSFTVTDRKSVMSYKDPCMLDHAWASQDEMKKRLKPKYFEAIKKILY